MHLLYIYIQDSDALPSSRYTINDDDIKKNIAEGPSESLDPSEAYIEMVPTETIYEGIILKLILERTQAWNGNLFSATRKKLLRLVNLSSPFTYVL